MCVCFQRVVQKRKRLEETEGSVCLFTLSRLASPHYDLLIGLPAYLRRGKISFQQLLHFYACACVSCLQELIQSENTRSSLTGVNGGHAPCDQDLFMVGLAPRHLLLLKENSR